ncbi:hypothetical protein MTR67_002232, partial [Solanum verrucosum]
GNGQPGDRAHCYAFPGRSEAETSDVVITGTLLVCDRMASVLFDPGSTFSYASSLFATGLDLHCDFLDMPIRVSIPVGEFVIVEKVYRSCLVTFVGGETYVDLIILDMVDFDVILGMTWLFPNFAILDCNAKTVTLAKPGIDPVVWEGDYIPAPIRIISFLHTKRLVSKGCLAFLARLKDDTSKVPSIESISIVREFTDVFAAELPVSFLGNVVSKDGVMVDPSKIEAVKSWARPTNVSELTNLTKQNVPFVWSNECEESFLKLKTLLTNAPILAMPVEGEECNCLCFKAIESACFMGSLAHLQVSRRPLAREVQTLANDFMRLEILEKGGFLACVEARSSFLDKIKGKQFEDEKLSRIRDMVLRGEAKKAVIDEEETHSSRYSIHPGATKMYRDLRQHYWWSRMKRDIIDFVAQCPNCQQVKYEHQRPGGTLQRMPIPEWKWERIAMDFVVGFPKTLGKFDSIWVIVDRLTKSAHFVPVKMTYNAEKLAKLYIREIVRLHGVPVSIISDRVTQFTSKFWRTLHDELGTRLDLSTAFHPQTDGQSERTIQELEDMLRACMIDFGGNWDQFLPLAEFSYNNSYHSSIDMAPFEALFGRKFKSPIGWFDSFEVRPWGTDLLRESLEKVKFIQEKLLAAQSRPKEFADRKVRDLEFMEGEQVLLKVSPMKGVMRFGKRGLKVDVCNHGNLSRDYAMNMMYHQCS